MRAPSIATDQDQRVTFVELFFDLVFVFAVTQLVRQLHDDLSWAGTGRAVLVFWLVWWAWTQFTWALNSADSRHPAVQGSVLLATAVAFAMAVEIPDAFGDAGVWFAGTYVAVRVIGLVVYGRVAWVDAAKRAALRRFTILSLGGLFAVGIGGVAEGDARVGWWATAVLLDLVAAVLAGAAEGWDIRPDHFAERHGLFVIIALGESLIVAASGLSDADRTAELVTVGVLVVAVTCVLWWTYFGWVEAALDHAVTALRNSGRTTLARDVYSILHFPIIFGIVLYAVAVEMAVEHPDEALPLAAVLALGGGVTLFVGGTAAALVRARAGSRVVLPRLLLLAVTVAGVLATQTAEVVWPLLVALLGVAAIAGVEQRSSAPRPSST